MPDQRIDPPAYLARPDDGDLIHAIGFALTHKVDKRHLRSLLKDHWPEEATMAAARIILEHLRRSQLDVLRVKPPASDGAHL